uniref:Transposase (putative) gypsy type domain-containing protein n=1 Tax=Fagus sylvatica TaxID=28930 RepID=A0A2N9G3V7_FAGSY
MPPTPYYRHILTMCGVLRWSGGLLCLGKWRFHLMTKRCFRRRVTRVIILLVGVLGMSLRQALAINEKASLRSVSDTCRRVIGRHARGIASSGFVTRVVMFAENGLGPPPIEGFVSPDSVLHRLSAELYSVICPAINTWEAVRNRMTANEAEWPLPLSEELPEGLSDESNGGVTREVSSEAVPSTSGSRPLPRVDRSWKAMSYFSKFRQDDVDRIRRRYQIPDDVVIRIPDPDERACCPKYEGDVAFYEADLRAGLRFPIQPFVRELLDFLSLAPGQVNPNGWRTIISCMVMWRVSSNGEEDLTVDEFLFCYEPVQIALSRGFWTFKNRDVNSRVVQGLPSSDRIWKDGYFFVCGDNWERLPQEGPNDFVGVRRSWGTPSSSALDRPLLNSVWQERISRILDIEDRRYSIFIEPDLLATFSLGPVPSLSVKALVRANKKRINTMKLNKNRLKQMAQSGEVAAAPISLKRKKPDEGSSKQAEEAPSRPSAPIATPPIIPTAVPSSPLVAMDRAKGAISSQDMDEYAVAYTDDLSLLMVHSLMQGLTEAMVMARRCASVEEDLALLQAKSITDEAEMKNVKRAVMELTRERKEALAEAENLRKELKARDDDVKAAVDAKDKAVADLKHLVGQIEGAKEAAVSEFRASEVFEDINTRYFLSGFEAFRKQAVQRFPGLDFSALQPYDDEDSVADVSQDQAGDEDVSSK